MRIQWEPYLWESPPPLALEEIERLEMDWGGCLPVSYKKSVAECQGMAPEPSGFSVGQGTNAICTFLTVSRVPGLEPYAIDTVLSLLKTLLPEGLFPFAMSSGREFLCLDRRESPLEPKVVFVTVEGHILPVASSFQDFMDGLKPV